MDRYETGELRVKAYTASQAIPLENVVVRIMGAGEENSEIQYSVLTDRDGNTDSIPLPAPPASYSASPGAPEAPYFTYDVTLIKDGYYIKTISNVPIFANINAQLPIEMIPLSFEKDGSIQRQDNINSIIYENENLM